MSHYTLAFSPCPNDTFIFAALVKNWIDTGGLTFEVHLEDVQSLNENAASEKYDFTKMSFGAFPALSTKYKLLSSGAALGNGCGPLLVSKGDFPEVFLHKDVRIATPGNNTTAVQLLRMFFPDLQNHTPMVFSEIMPAVASGEFHLGLIIHESRFTYAHHGLRQISDLGTLWEERFHMPLPLGGIFGATRLPHHVLQEVNRLVRLSIQYAFQYPEKVMDYVSSYAQEMSPDVMKNHISLYVNDYSLELGKIGINALLELFSHTSHADFFSGSEGEWFISSNFQS